jgi:S1-C subfamily serine protease
VAALEGTLEHIYSEVNPSVVTIRVVQTQEVNVPVLPEIPGFPFFGGPSAPQTQVQQALGSGFVWDKEGHIVTNNHVVAGADTISVTFYDGTTVPGKVVGADPASDLAVVKVNVPADQLRPVQMADST